MHDKNTRLYYWYPSENWPPKSVQEPGEIRTLRVHGINATCVTAHKPPFHNSRIMLLIAISLSITKFPPEQRVEQRGMIQSDARSSTSIASDFVIFVLGHCGPISVCYPARATLALAISSSALRAWVWCSLNSNPPTALRRSSHALWAKPLAQPSVYPEASLCLSSD